MTRRNDLFALYRNNTGGKSCHTPTARILDREDVRDLNRMLGYWPGDARVQNMQNVNGRK